jgi:hypothetical protein
MEITIPYHPRTLQKKLHDEMQRFNVIVCHRRFGKTVFAINELIKKALTTTLKKPRVAYICPLHKQAKTVAWDYVKEFTRVIPGMEYNEAELRADFPNSARLQLFGADNPDALRGIYLDQVVLDEYSQMSPKAWSEVIRPALADREGSAIFIGTPMGMNNFYQRYSDAVSLDGWYRVIYKASETGIIKAGELEAARREMSPEEYEQEFECSWSAAIKGAYYGKLMQLAEEDSRIGKVPYDPLLQVITSWDLGISDATAIWFWQVTGAEIRAIDYEEYQGMGLPDIIKRLKDKPYIYKQHIGPHDIKVREFGSGKSRIESALDLGIRFDIAPNQSVADGINAVRGIIPRTWFDAEKCKHGIESLKQYRTEYNDKRGTFRLNPLHDWSSHAADSVRYFAITRLKQKTTVYDDWSIPVNG